MVTGIFNQEAKDIFIGLVDALLAKENLNEISECMKDSREVAKEVNDIWGMLKKETISDTIHAVKAIGALLQTLPTDVAACEAMKSDFGRIEEYVKIFAHPARFVSTVTKNIGKHHSQIFEDIADTSKDLDAKDYKGAGATIADIVIQTLGDFPAAAPENLQLTQW